jgi:hypothetical protein
MLQLVPFLFLQASPDAVLIDRIARLAASEPVEFGIDSRLKLAQALASKYPEKAKRQLRDAEASLPGVSDAQAGNMWRTQIVQALAPLDFDEAERLTKSIAPDREHDYLAAAYDELYARLGKRDRVAFIHNAIAAGAFRLKCAAKQLSELKTTAPGEALALFEKISNAFPDDPDRQDVEYLQERTKEMAVFDSDIVRAAAKKAGPPAKPADESKKPDSEESKHVGALIDLSRREDLSRQEQARLASEALIAVGKMKIIEDRLLGLSMLSRDFVKRQEYSSAALAAQMLSETYTQACGCGTSTCQVDTEKFDCIDLMNGFAEYLHELNLSQESMGLQNISLEARLLIYALQGGTGLQPVHDR